MRHLFVWILIPLLGCDPYLIPVGDPGPAPIPTLQVETTGSGSVQILIGEDEVDPKCVGVCTYPLGNKEIELWSDPAQTGWEGPCQAGPDLNPCRIRPDSKSNSITVKIKFRSAP